MYIIEKLVKLYLNLSKKNKSTAVIENTEDNEYEDIVTCRHNFMPVDSTGQVFACSKCGYIISKKRLNKKK